MKFLIVFIPVLMTIALALRDQYGRKNISGSVLLTMTSLLVMMRFCVLAYFFDGGDRLLSLEIMEQVSSMYIMPCTYMYLCDQCGTQWRNRATVFMLCLPLVALASYVPEEGLFGWRDWIVISQCVIIAVCMVFLRQRILKYRMRFTRQIKLYYVWMTLLLLFTVISFAIGMDCCNGEGMHWTFFIYYTIVLSSGFLLIPYSFRVMPAEAGEVEEAVPAEEETTPVVEEVAPAVEETAPEATAVAEPGNDVPAAAVVEDDGDQADEGFISQNAHLVAAVHKLMEEDHYYLQSSIGIDDMAHRLGTNRTYVTRILRHEYGLSFIEYVNVARIQYSQKILYTNPNITLDELVLKCGFTSTSNYCRAFKRYTGTTPKAWLQQLRDAQ